MVMPNSLLIKFTDFGLGCGYINAGIGNIMNIDDYQKDKFFNLLTCKNKNKNNIPIKILEDIIEKLSESAYLQISQKYEL